MSLSISISTDGTSSPGRSPKRHTGIYLGEANKFQELFLSSSSPSYASSPSPSPHKSYSSPLSVSSGGSQRLSPAGGTGSPLSMSLQQLILREQMQAHKAEQERRIKNAQKVSLAKRDAKRDERFGALSDSYEESRELLDELDAQLTLADESKRTKTRRQYEAWNQDVHGAIQQKIQTSLSKQSPEKLHQKKNEDYQKFLDIINRKGGVFRDIIIENEYDPMEVNRKSLKVRTGLLKDPTHIDKLKLAEEGGSPTKSAARNTLSVEEWADGKIQATPFGRKGPVNKDGELAPPRPRHPNSEASLVMNHFHYPQGRHATDSESPKGKATFPRKLADPFPPPPNFNSGREEGEGDTF